MLLSGLWSRQLITHYLVGTQNYTLVYKGESRLEVHACSDWASNPNDRRSQTGYYLMIAGSIFSWMSQQIVALSSAETKYMALSDCSCQCV